MVRFTGLNNTAHTLVCLRINPAVTGETARLTADLPGSALIGRDLHPLDDFSKFHKVTVTSLLSDQQSLVATGKSFGTCHPGRFPELDAQARGIVPVPRRGLFPSLARRAWKSPRMIPPERLASCDQALLV